MTSCRSSCYVSNHLSAMEDYIDRLDRYGRLADVTGSITDLAPPVFCFPMRMRLCPLSTCAITPLVVYTRVWVCIGGGRIYIGWWKRVMIYGIPTRSRLRASPNTRRKKRKTWFLLKFLFLHFFQIKELSFNPEEYNCSLPSCFPCLFSRDSFHHFYDTSRNVKSRHG